MKNTDIDLEAINAASRRSLEELGDLYGLTIASVPPIRAKPAASHVSEYLIYRNIPVNFEGGVDLLDSKATRVRIWATDIWWKWSPAPDDIVTTPTGHGGEAPSGWAFPRMPVFGIVLSQIDSGRFSITGTERANAQEFQVTNGRNLHVNVNDKFGTFGDNGGAYWLHVEILQR